MSTFVNDATSGLVKRDSELLAEALDEFEFDEGISIETEALDLSNKRVTHIELGQLLFLLPKVTKLNLANTDVANLSFLRHCPHLTHLGLSNCHLLPFDAFIALEKLPKLCHLDCSGCRGFNDVAARSLSNLSELSFCDLSDCTELTDECLTSLPLYVEYLFLKGVPNLTDEAPQKLQRLERLISVDLSATYLSGATLAKLNSLTQLDGLGLWRCSRVKDEHLAWLKERAMRRVDVSFCTQLTDVALGYFRKVTDLSLDGCQYLTDVGLRSLLDTPRAKTISFARCPHITPTCRQDLQKVNKELQIALRHTYDEDPTMGYMRDLHPDTIKAVVDMVDTADWRSLGNGLGVDFRTLRDYRSIGDVLTLWMDRTKRATVKRLEFEASLCGMQNVCNFLHSIPLEFVVKKWLPTNPEKGLERPITYFDMQHIDEIMIRRGNSTIAWASSLEKLGCNGLFGNAHKLDPRYIIGASGTIELKTILGFMTTGILKVVRDDFIAELEGGSWEPKSPGGVTYSQIEHLAQTVKRLENTISYPLCAHLKGDLSLEHLKGRPISFADMLFLFWQGEAISKLNLADFVETLLSILAKNNGTLTKEVARALTESYLEIKPYRHHLS